MSNSSFPATALMGPQGATGVQGTTGPTGPGYDAAQTVSSNANTSYTFTTSDPGKYIRFTAASAISLTVPTNAAQAIAIGQHIDFMQANTAQITVAGDTGVTVNSSNGLKSRAQYSVLTLIKVATNEWDLHGDTSA